MLKPLAFSPNIKTLWGLLPKTKNVSLSELTPTSAPTSKEFIGYKEIKLRLYVEIIETGDVRKLLTAGTATDEECATAWDAIVAENDRTAGGYKYVNYLNLIKDYGNLFSQYLAVKATLTALQFQVDDADISWLQSLGYKIDTSTSQLYVASLKRADQRSKNLINRMGLRLNEINVDRVKGPAVPSSFDYIMANLSEALGREVNDELTLARYNEYCKIAKAKIDAKRQRNVLQHG